MKRTNVFFIVLITVILLVGAGVAAYILVFPKLKKEPAVNPPLVPIRQSTNLEVASGGVVKSVQAGISKPVTDPKGYTTVRITGNLTRVSTSSDGHYFFEISGVPYLGKSYGFQIDLGTKNFNISDYSVSISSANNPANPNAIKVTEKNSASTAETIYAKYKDQLDKVFALDIVTAVPAQSPAEILDFYNTYAKQNKELENPESHDPNAYFQVGVVFRVNGTGYVY